MGLSAKWDCSTEKRHCFGCILLMIHLIRDKIRNVIYKNSRIFVVVGIGPICCGVKTCGRVDTLALRSPDSGVGPIIVRTTQWPSGRQLQW